FSSRRRHTRFSRDWSSDVCSSDLRYYQYRSEPTMIDFRGTVLMPKAKGEAVVESKRGRTEIDAKLDHLEDPQRFGREYLTYVLRSEERRVGKEGVYGRSDCRSEEY